MAWKKSVVWNTNIFIFITWFAYTDLR